MNISGNAWSVPGAPERFVDLGLGSCQRDLGIYLSLPLFFGACFIYWCIWPLGAIPPDGDQWRYDQPANYGNNGLSEALVLVCIGQIGEGHDTCGEKKDPEIFAYSQLFHCVSPKHLLRKGEFRSFLVLLSVIRCTLSTIRLPRGSPLDLFEGLRACPDEHVDDVRGYVVADNFRNQVYSELRADPFI